MDSCRWVSALVEPVEVQVGLSAELAIGAMRQGRPTASFATNVASVPNHFAPVQAMYLPDVANAFYP